MDAQPKRRRTYTHALFSGHMLLRPPATLPRPFYWLRSDLTCDLLLAIAHVLTPVFPRLRPPGASILGGNPGLVGGAHGARLLR